MATSAQIMGNNMVKTKTIKGIYASAIVVIAISQNHTSSFGTWIETCTSFAISLFDLPASHSFGTAITAVVTTFAVATTSPRVLVFDRVSSVIFETAINQPMVFC